MKRVGVRELRQHASRYLRDVEAGQSLEVTDRGRPVAMLVPARRQSRWEQLVARGRVLVAKGDILELGAPLPARKDIPPPSELLARARDDER